MVCLGRATGPRSSTGDEVRANAAAVDNISDIYDEFARTDTPIFIRGLCMQTLQQWIAWNRDQDYELLKAVKKYHNNKTTVSVKILELFHGVSSDEARKPATYQHLIENLNNEVLPIRTLSHWHLIKLAPAGGEIHYDPAMFPDRRQVAIRQWIGLIPPGQLPGAVPPKTSDSHSGLRISGVAPTGVPRTGVPHASASTVTSPKPSSSRVGRTKTSAA